MNVFITVFSFSLLLILWGAFSLTEKKRLGLFCGMAVLAICWALAQVRSFSQLGYVLLKEGATESYYSHPEKKQLLIWEQKAGEKKLAALYSLNELRAQGSITHPLSLRLVAYYPNARKRLDSKRLASQYHRGKGFHGLMSALPYRLERVKREATPLRNRVGLVLVSEKTSRQKIYLFEGDEVKVVQGKKVYFLSVSPQKRPLPFGVRLLKLRLEYYPGGEMVKTGVANLQLLWKKEQNRLALPLNRGLNYKGYQIRPLYSWKVDRRYHLILEVRPLAPWVSWLAPITLVLLALLLLWPSRWAGLSPKGIWLIAFLLPASLQAAPRADALVALPVQEGGRIKSFRTYGREVLYGITGRERWRGRDGAFWLAQILFSPEKARQERWIPLSSSVIRRLGLTSERRHYSLAELEEHWKTIEGAAAKALYRPWESSPSDRELVSLYNRLVILTTLLKAFAFLEERPVTKKELADLGKVSYYRIVSLYLTWKRWWEKRAQLLRQQFYLFSLEPEWRKSFEKEPRRALRKALQKKQLPLPPKMAFEERNLPSGERLILLLEGKKPLYVLVIHQLKHRRRKTALGLYIGAVDVYRFQVSASSETVVEHLEVLSKEYSRLKALEEEAKDRLQNKVSHPRSIPKGGLWQGRWQSLWEVVVNPHTQSRLERELLAEWIHLRRYWRSGDEKGVAKSAKSLQFLYSHFRGSRKELGLLEVESTFSPKWWSGFALVGFLLALSFWFLGHYPLCWVGYSLGFFALTYSGLVWIQLAGRVPVHYLWEKMFFLALLVASLGLACEAARVLRDRLDWQKRGELLALGALLSFFLLASWIWLVKGVDYLRPLELERQMSWRGLWGQVLLLLGVSWGVFSLRLGRPFGPVWFLFWASAFFLGLERLVQGQLWWGARSGEVALYLALGLGAGAMKMEGDCRKWLAAFSLIAGFLALGDYVEASLLPLVALVVGFGLNVWFFSTRRVCRSSIGGEESGKVCLLPSVKLDTRREQP